MFGVVRCACVWSGEVCVFGVVRCVCLEWWRCTCV